MLIRDFRNIILLIIASILITIVIPGIVSSLGGTFYLKDISLKISQNERNKMNFFQEQSKSLNFRILEIDKKINKHLNQNNSSEILSITELLKIKEAYLLEKQNLKPPLNIVPYYLNPQMLLWIGIYTAFLLSIYLITIEQTIKITFSKKLFSFSILVYTFYEWPLWLRNFVLTNEGRTVYAYTNYDIDIYSFFYQELIIYLFALLSSILIFSCIKCYEKSSSIKEDPDINDFLIVSSYYSIAYRNWFIHSIILALGFLSFTSFFWRLVFKYEDHRYIVSALNAHIIWALTWIAISLNLLKHMQLFDKIKRSILKSHPNEMTLKIVMEHQPANNITLIISGAASLLTFLLPLIKVMIK